MFVAQDTDLALSNQPHFSEEPGVYLDEHNRPRSHRRTPSFGEFFSSSSRWLVDQLQSCANPLFPASPKLSSSPRGSMVSSPKGRGSPQRFDLRGEDSNEDFLPWLLPGSSSPQESTFGDLCTETHSEYDALSEFALDESNPQMPDRNRDVEMTSSPICGESDDEDADGSYEWAMRLSHSFKDRFSSWKHQLLQSVAGSDRFILRESDDQAIPRAHDAVQNELVNPYVYSFDIDMQDDEAYESNEDPSFSYSTLTQRATAFWKESIIASVPQKIEEVSRTSSTLFAESIAEIRAGSAGLSTFDRVRTQSLVRAYNKFQEKSNSLLFLLRQLVQQDISPLLREAYEDAVQGGSAGLSHATTIPIRAAQNVKEKFSQLLEGLISNLEADEREMDGALQQVLFVLRSKETEKKREEEERYSQWQPMDDSLSVAGVCPTVTQTGKQHKKRLRVEPEHCAGRTYVLIDEAAPDFFAQEMWERFFSTTSDVPIRYLLLEQRLSNVGLGFCEVKSDGNCQFRALAHQMYGSEEAHLLVRALLVQEIANHPLRYPQFRSDEDLKNYISAMSKEGQRGDRTTLCAMTNLYSVDIFIYCPTLMDPLFILSKTGASQKILYLTYINDNHYQSLVRIGSQESETLIGFRPPKRCKNVSEEQLADNLQLLKISQMNLDYESGESTLLEQQPLIERLDASEQVSPISNIGTEMATDTQPLVSQQQKARGSPLSLLQLCLANVANSIDSMPHLESILPEDLLQRLIKHLVAVGKLNDFVLPRLLTPSFNSLHLPKCKMLTDNGFHHIAAKCSNLLEVDISGCVNIAGESLVGLSKNCPSLRYLDLEGCVGIPAASIPAIVQNCTELLSLNLSGTCVTDRALVQVLRQCPKLSRLLIRNCTQITDAGFGPLGPGLQCLDLSECSISDRTIYHIALKCPDLRSLRLSSCRVTDAAMEKLCRSCPRITSLVLASCDSLTDTTVHTIARHCSSLHTLSLSFCKKITDNAFLSPASPFSEHDFPTIQHLDLTRCINLSDSSLKQIAMRCPNLRILNLSSCEDITDEAVILAADLCSTLEDLDLSKCKNITDIAISAIAQQCKHLHRLCLYNCSKITDGSITRLASRCHQLSSLDLSSCENITDASLQSLSKGCKLLTTLSLEECQHTTDLGISSLAEGCPELHTLRMAYCKGITDLSLHVLSEACPNITFIDLSYCLNLTLPGIQQAIERWTNLTTLSLRGNSNIAQGTLRHNTLQSLNLSWCKNLEDLTISSIAKGCPGLQNLDLSWCSKLDGSHIGDLSRFCAQLRSVNLKGCNRVPMLSIKSFSTESKVKVYH